jgi:hypothetical protein
MAGEIGKIKKILAKRVTPGASRRRKLSRSVGYVPNADYFVGG